MFGRCSANRLRVGATSLAHTSNSRTFLKSRGRNRHSEHTSVVAPADLRSALDAGDSELPRHPNLDFRPAPAEPLPQQNPCIWPPFQYRYRDSNPGFRRERAIEGLTASGKIGLLQARCETPRTQKVAKRGINVRQVFVKGEVRRGRC